MIRKFWLKNSKDEIYTFTDEKKKAFLSSPSGLGFTKSISGVAYGNKTLITSSVYDFLKISGTLLLYEPREKAYQDYFDFVKYLSYTPLKLYYQPPNTLKSYFCDIEVLQTDKGEYSTSGMLEIPLSMQMLSHWQDADETIIVATNYVEDGKYYDLERPYYYGENALDNIILNNTGNDEVGIIVEVNGSIVNPQWTINQDGEVYGSCKLNGTFDKVIVNSKDGENEIYLENGGSVITNPASYQDLSISGGTLTFIKLKVGKSQMVFTAGNIASFSGDVKVHLRNSYISV